MTFIDLLGLKRMNPTFFYLLSSQLEMTAMYAGSACASKGFDTGDTLPSGGQRFKEACSLESCPV